MSFVKQVFNIDGGVSVTGVVVDDFDGFLSWAAGGLRLSDFDVVRLWEFSPVNCLVSGELVDPASSVDHVPLIERNEGNEFIFRRFGIDTDYASFVRSGAGVRVLSNLIGYYEV